MGGQSARKLRTPTYFSALSRLPTSLVTTRLSRENKETTYKYVSPHLHSQFCSSLNIRHQKKGVPGTLVHHRSYSLISHLSLTRVTLMYYSGGSSKPANGPRSFRNPSCQGKRQRNLGSRSCHTDYYAQNLVFLFSL